MPICILSIQARCPSGAHQHFMDPSEVLTLVLACILSIHLGCPSGARLHFIDPNTRYIQKNGREYDWTYHGMIVFDNVNNMDFVMKFGGLLQANNDVHVLGASATGVYSYRVWLWKVPVVFTVDTQATWDRDNKWVEENCWEVTFAEPCYTT